MKATLEATELITTTDLAAYNVTEQALMSLKERLSGLKIIPGDNRSYEAVRLGITECRELRVAVEKRRVELKEGLLKQGRLIDKGAKAITETIERIEDPLKAEKKLVDGEAERLKQQAEEAAKAKLLDQNRQLQALGEPIELGRTAPYLDSDFELILQGAKSRKAERDAAEAAAKAEQARIAAEQKAEADRLALLRAEQEAELDAERAKLQAERDAQATAASFAAYRLSAELAAERSKLQAERDAQATAAKSEAYRLDAELASRQAKLQAERNAQATAAKHEAYRLDAELARLRAEQERLDRIEFERLAKERAEKEAAAKIERERLSAAAKAKADAEEAERQATLLPEKLKILKGCELLEKAMCDFPAATKEPMKNAVDVARKEVAEIIANLRIMCK